MIGLIVLALSMTAVDQESSSPSFDQRATLSRDQARAVYDKFAVDGHAGGQDADSGYGGPAITALLDMADFANAHAVVDYGCGQGKLCHLVLKTYGERNPSLTWLGIDQSPEMQQRFTKRCVKQFGTDRCSIQLIKDGDPTEANSIIDKSDQTVDRFVSTYCLDLLSEDDMYQVLELAQRCLDPEEGLLLLAGITWGYRGPAASLQTAAMTAIWEVLYAVQRTRVGGCRPQRLQPYLEAKGWRITQVMQTKPAGFPWMVSEVIAARPPVK